jgi:hypothetical protein
VEEGEEREGIREEKGERGKGKGEKKIKDTPLLVSITDQQ